MKTVFIFILGALAGAYLLHVYRQPAPSLTAQARTVAETVGAKTHDTAVSVKDSVSDKLQDWHLTADDIKADLDKTGQVVRSKTAAAGDRIGDARIVTVVKAKYVLDRDLSAHDLKIDCRDGEVLLTGVVATPALIGRATALALETDGVRRVTSLVKVKPHAP